MTTITSRWQRWIRGFGSSRKAEPVTSRELQSRLEQGRRDLADRLSQRKPRLALVKQDVCEDLYCAPSSASPRELVESTQLRSGPVALLSPLDAAFHVLETVDAPECQLWQERANDLHWDTLEFFRSYQDRIPGQEYGQRRFAVYPTAIDWSQYDIVISIDVAVPAAVTRRFPQTVWAYFVREIKAPSFARSLQTPASGQDLFLNHGFRWSPPPTARHVVEFPYHLQYWGCFHDVFAVTKDEPRDGVFIDHHTLVTLTDMQRDRLAQFGPAVGPLLPAELRLEGGKSVPPRRTMDPDLRERLLRSKYFVMTPGQRRVYGTALVEAIAAGCLAIGSPAALESHGFVFTPATSADTVEDAVERITALEHSPQRFNDELQRQRDLIDWCCFMRPTLELFDKADAVRAHRMRP